MTLTAEEVARGWAEFHCPAHGFLVATTSNAEVTCRCGKAAETAKQPRRQAPADAISGRSRRRHRQAAEAAKATET